MASMMQSVSTMLTSLPISTNGLAPGAGEAYSVPTMGAVTVCSGFVLTTDSGALGAAAGATAGPGAGAAAYCTIGAADGLLEWRLMRTDSSPSLISISAMPDSSSSSISFLTLRMSM